MQSLITRASRIRRTYNLDHTYETQRDEALEVGVDAEVFFIFNF